MIHILLPSMGKSVFFKDYYFPKPLVEINGQTMLELVMKNYESVNNKEFICVFSEEDCLKFHLDASVNILAPDSKVIKLKKQTAGALCTCLMAIEYINDECPLVIANSDQIIEADYNDIIHYFEAKEADAGVITFPDIHPRWCYARKKDDAVIEVAEKCPISRDAVAGFYYFKKGQDFVEAAEAALRKQNNLDGQYYISASMNEMILMNKKVTYYEISKEQYRSFYSPAKIKEYEECGK